MKKILYPIICVAVVIGVVALNIFFTEPSYRAKKFLNHYFGFSYRLDIYPEFHDGDLKATEYIRNGDYEGFNLYMRAISNPTE